MDRLISFLQQLRLDNNSAKTKNHKLKSLLLRLCYQDGGLDVTFISFIFYFILEVALASIFRDTKIIVFIVIVLALIILRLIIGTIYAKKSKGVIHVYYELDCLNYYILNIITAMKDYKLNAQQLSRQEYVTYYLQMLYNKLISTSNEINELNFKPNSINEDIKREAVKHLNYACARLCEFVVTERQERDSILPKNWELKK